jgi:hypothetical protein
MKKFKRFTSYILCCECVEWGFAWRKSGLKRVNLLAEVMIFLVCLSMLRKWRERLLLYSRSSQSSRLLKLNNIKKWCGFYDGHNHCCQEILEDSGAHGMMDFTSSAWNSTFLLYFIVTRLHSWASKSIKAKKSHTIFARTFWMTWLGYSMEQTKSFPRTFITQKKKKKKKNLTLIKFRKKAKKSVLNYTTSH